MAEHTRIALVTGAFRGTGRATALALAATDVVAFLRSDKARWITGASIPVDGGSKL